MRAWPATQIQQAGGVLLDSRIVLRRWRVSPGWMVGLPPPATDSGRGQALPGLSRAEVTDAVHGSELMDSRNYWSCSKPPPSSWSGPRRRLQGSATAGTNHGAWSSGVGSGPDARPTTSLALAGSADAQAALREETLAATDRNLGSQDESDAARWQEQRRSSPAVGGFGSAA
jgi:hypothetical protein